MRRRAGVIRQFFLVTAACVLAGVGSFALCEAEYLQKTVSLACVGQEITREQIDDIRKMEAEKEGGNIFTAWTEKDGGYVCLPDGARPVGTRVIELDGSSELLIPYGKILREDDLQGCLLGRETAEKLFGSRNAEGLAVCYGERKLTVRGVLKEPEDLLVAAAGEETQTFRRITLKSDAPVAAGIAADRFIQNYGIFARQIHYDFMGPDYLQSLVPGKWSDFAGWRESLKTAGEDIRFLAAVEKSCLETRYLACLLRASVCIAAGAILLLFIILYNGKSGWGMILLRQKKQKILHLLSKSSIIDK